MCMAAYVPSIQHTSSLSQNDCANLQLEPCLTPQPLPVPRWQAVHVAMSPATTWRQLHASLLLGLQQHPTHRLRPPLGAALLLHVEDLHAAAKLPCSCWARATAARLIRPMLEELRQLLDCWVRGVRGGQGQQVRWERGAAAMWQHVNSWLHAAACLQCCTARLHAVWFTAFGTTHTHPDHHGVLCCSVVVRCAAWLTKCSQQAPSNTSMPRPEPTLFSLPPSMQR
jgi:hypothetical protein